MHNFKTRSVRLSTQERGRRISRGKAEAQRKRERTHTAKVNVVLLIVATTVISAFSGMTVIERKESEPPAIKIAEHAQAEPNPDARYYDEIMAYINWKLDQRNLTPAEKEKRMGLAEFAWQLAKERGMPATDRVTFLKVLECESRGLDEYAENLNEHPQQDGTVLYSLDRGIAQFNDYWYPNIPESCVYDGQCAINEAITVANRNGDFNQWHCVHYIN